MWLKISITFLPGRFKDQLYYRDYLGCFQWQVIETLPHTALNAKNFVI